VSFIDVARDIERYVVQPAEALPGMIYSDHSSGNPTGEQLGVSLSRVGISSFYQPSMLIKAALKTSNKQ